MNLDVHIIVHPEDRRDWLLQAIASIPAEAKLHFGKYIEGKPALARWEAYKLGSCDYVAFVDPDDYYLPGALKQMLEALQANSDAVAVFCGQHAMNMETGKLSVYSRPHSGVIYRRKFVERHIDLVDVCPHGFELRLADKAVGEYVTIEFPKVGHVWRVHESKCAKLRGYLGDRSRVL